MARQPVCEAPKCRVEDGLRVCPSTVPVYGQGCRERRRDEFHPDSLFFKPSGKSMILIGCLRENWDPQARKCLKGTRALQSITAI